VSPSGGDCSSEGGRSSGGDWDWGREAGERELPSEAWERASWLRTREKPSLSGVLAAEVAWGVLLW